MSDPHVDRWRPQGRVCMWKHKSRHTDWNLAADEMACDALLDLLQRMRDAEWPSHRLFTLTKPEVTATGAPADRPAWFAKQWSLKYPKSMVADDHWSLDTTQDHVRLAIGRSRLDDLAEAVVDMKRGGGDYAIGKEDAPLWTWWWVEA